MRWSFAGWLVAGLLCGQGLAPEVLLLARIRTHMHGVLEKQPNYTCSETVERSRRRSANKRFELVDALHLEVAVVDGKELFAWPGEREFKDRDLRELAPGGAMGNGSFALHARSVFLTNSATITYKGPVVMDGRETVRYDYEVPLLRSRYTIRVGDVQGIAGYRGSFWADEKTLDLVRLEVEAFDIPPQVMIKGTMEKLRYARAKIGESNFLLPQVSEMTMIDFMGNESLNRTTFSRCRQYAGESTLSFEEVPLETVPLAAPGVTEPIVTPGNLLLEVDLGAPVKFGVNGVGDEIELKVRRDVKRKGQVLVPKGALLVGNISLLERRLAGLYAVAFVLREIVFEGRRGVLDAELEEGGAIKVGRGLSPAQPYFLEYRRLSDAPQQRNVFYVRKESLELPRGLPMLWRTVVGSRAGAEKQ